jgi:amidophosphoribosyltransferase
MSALKKVLRNLTPQTIYEDFMTALDQIENELFYKLREECGVVGIIGVPQASSHIYLSLFALQHRGQEGAGMVIFPSENESKDRFPVQHKDFGLVSEVFSKEKLSSMEGTGGVGHVRYSTTGGASKDNIQPFLFRSTLGPVAIAHNGNLTNAESLRKSLEASGSVFQSTSDSEIFVHLIARSKASTLREKIIDAISKVKGAFSLVIKTNEMLFALRDSAGLRPLSVASFGRGFVVASETCAFDLLGAEFIREVEAGELLSIDWNGIKSEFPWKKASLNFCAFEPIYFARPDSMIFGESIYVTRRRIGNHLATECPADADVIIPIPDSGVAMAEGFAETSKIPFAMGLVRNHYVGRTFIQPGQAARDTGVRMKLNPVKSVIEGKRVVVVDDSLVRGTTAYRILKLLKDAGAKEIHLRIGAPPITHSCYYGVDTPDREGLMAAQMTVDQMRKTLEVQSLGFVSLDGLSKALAEGPGKTYCKACFSGKYPVELEATIRPQPTDASGTGLFSR